MEGWNVWFLLDLFILQSTNWEVNEKRVSFSACCTILPFTYKFTVVRCWGFGGLVVLLYEKDWKDFFVMPFFQENYFGFFFSWAKCFSNNGLIFLCKRMNLSSELDRWQLIAFQILILFKTTSNILKIGNMLHHADRNSGITCYCF